MGKTREASESALVRKSAMAGLVPQRGPHSGSCALSHSMKPAFSEKSEQAARSVFPGRWMLPEHLVRSLAHLSPCESQSTKLFLHISVMHMNEVLSVQNRIIHSTNTGFLVPSERKNVSGSAVKDGDRSVLYFL